MVGLRSAGTASDVRDETSEEEQPDANRNCMRMRGISKMFIPLTDDEMAVDNGWLDLRWVKDEHARSSCDEIDDATDVKEDVDLAALLLREGSRPVGFDPLVLTVVWWWRL